jgi:hypothetical protein
MFGRWLSAFAFISACSSSAAGQQIRGTVVDAGAAGFRGAYVRLFKSGSETVEQTRADDWGNFEIGIAVPGNYVLKVWQPSFRCRRLTVVVGA